MDAIFGGSSRIHRGWNSWNLWACDINETIVRATAEAMVNYGLRDLGYVYINIDDCWQVLVSNGSNKV